MFVLVRHAHGGEKTSWRGPDAVRPLSTPGYWQVRSLVPALTGIELRALFASPTTRCHQALLPLAAASDGCPGLSNREGRCRDRRPRRRPGPDTHTILGVRHREPNADRHDERESLNSRIRRFRLRVPTGTNDGRRTHRPGMGTEETVTATTAGNRVVERSGAEREPGMGEARCRNEVRGGGWDRALHTLCAGGPGAVGIEILHRGCAQIHADDRGYGFSADLSAGSAQHHRHHRHHGHHGHEGKCRRCHDHPHAAGRTTRHSHATKPMTTVINRVAGRSRRRTCRRRVDGPESPRHRCSPRAQVKRPGGALA
ncbi:hypothetical protein FXW78_46640 [Rhodococcus opacus]|nr:hypothetical protein [Rhodococcus opacus]